MEQAFTTTTMTTEEEAPEVGPNDIVIHLVNPFKCGMCELEFLDKAVFKEHIFNHLEQIKHEKPSSQIVMNIVLPPETPGGVTVTRDILQLGEDGSIKQVIQPANSITLNQVLPLKELEAAGVLKLDHSQPPPPAPVVPAGPKIAGSQSVSFQTPVAKTTKTVSTVPPSPANEAVTATESNASILEPAFIKEEADDVSEIIENTDGTFSVAFKGPNNEMQHIQIIRPEGMKGDMMLELTNPHVRRPPSKSKINECDICGKILSSSTNLLRHKMYHSEERPFVCQSCGKGFKDVSNLKKHSMIHNRIFPCHLCKKSFLRKSLLAAHLKRHQARTVFVKSGSGAKEVTLKTFLDDDGTRVEEMSMAALQGQTFEYRKRIVKADPQDVKPNMESELETSTNSISGDSAEQGENVAPASPGEVRNFVLNDDGTLESVDPQGAEKDKTGQAVDDVPDMELQDAPKDFVKMYQCGHCGKRTVQRGNMMRHLIHHLRDKPFKCEECPKQFVDKGELVKHIKTHTKPYRCNRCDGAFAHNVQLTKHQETECLGDKEQLNYTILDDAQTYRCDICQIEMKRLGNMIKHVGTHTGKTYSRKNLSAKLKAAAKIFPVLAPYSYNASTRKFQCNHCDQVFNEKKLVHQHVKSEHANKKQGHQCPDCDIWFYSTEKLKEHAPVHAKPFKCDQCSASFAHKILLESHKRKHEEKDREEETPDYGKSDDKINYYCKHCNKKLLKKFRMMNHIRRHLDQRPFECSDCNKCFSTQYMLSNHKKIHAKLFTCENCGEAFTRKLFLQIHRKKHEEHFEVVGENAMATPVGGVKRRHSQDMTEGASGESEYSCSICGTPFNRLVIKTNHERKCKEENKVLMRLASGDGYRCKICNRTATLKHNLMVHIKKHHLDIVKIDPSGEIHVREEDIMTEILLSPKPGSESANVTPVVKRIRLSSSKSTSTGPKMTVWDFDKNQDSDEADMDFDEEMDDEEALDERYTKLTGGYACNVCRRKFTDRDTVVAHHISHEEEKTKTPAAKEKEEETTVVEKESETAAKTNGEQEIEGEENSSISKTSVVVVAAESLSTEETPQESTEETPQKSTEETPQKSTEETPQESTEETPQEEVKTPETKIDRSAKAEATPAVSATKSAKVKTDVSVKKEIASTPPSTPSRSSARPSRSQKIPSRFLE